MILSNFEKAALIVLDSHGRVQQWSDAAAALTGVGARSALNAVLADLIPSALSDPDPLRDLAAHASTARLSDNRLRVGAHGRQMSLGLDICPIGGSAEEALRFAVMLQNREQVHDRLLRERLQNLTEQTALIGHWRLDIVTRSMHWSDGVYRIHGLPIGSRVTLEKALGFLVPEDRAPVEKALDDAIGLRLDYAFRATLRRPDGVFRTVDVKGRPEFDEHGEAVALFGVIRDVTTETEASRCLIKARDEATAAAEAQMLLLATMSHEIRTPLSGIIGMLEMLREESDTEIRRRALASVEGASKTLLAVLNDVLDHTKIESGELTLERIPFDLAELVASAANLFHPSAEEKRLTFECHVAGSLPVIGDPVRVQQILSNFLSNAIKFTDEGCVRAHIRDEGEAGILIEVIDTGIGIPREKLQDLFTPFRQAEVSTTRKFGGSGLGLAICKRLAEAMQGTIGAESRSGEGSTFWVRLPLERSPHAPSEQEQPSRQCERLPLLAGEAACILVVDDVETNRLIAEAHLLALGARVRTADNGFDGVKLLCGGGIDAVLMDGAMPLLNGLQAVELIRMLPPPLRDIPIIGYTAYSLSESHESMQAAGMDAVLEKPLDRAAALQTLSSLLENRTKVGPLRNIIQNDVLHKHAALAARVLRNGESDLVGETLTELCDRAIGQGAGELTSCARFALDLVDKLDIRQSGWLADFLLDLVEEEDSLS